MGDSSRKNIKKFSELCANLRDGGRMDHNVDWFKLEVQLYDAHLSRNKSRYESLTIFGRLWYGFCLLRRTRLVALCKHGFLIGSRSELHRWKAEHLSFPTHLPAGGVLGSEQLDYEN